MVSLSRRLASLLASHVSRPMSNHIMATPLRPPAGGQKQSVLLLARGRETRDARRETSGDDGRQDVGRETIGRIDSRKIFAKKQENEQ